MKKYMVWLLVLLLVTGCAGAEAYVPENAFQLPMDEQLELDLDNDGGAEKLQLRMEGLEDEAILRLIIEGTDGAVNIYDTWIMYPETCFIIDMNGDERFAWNGFINGSYVDWHSFSHCLVLIGYNDYNYVFCDPLNGIVEYSKEDVEISFEINYRQACIIK